MKNSRLIHASMFVISLLMTSCQGREQSVTPDDDTVNIKVNQIGFLPAENKIAIVPETLSSNFELHNAATGEVVFAAELRGAKRWPYSDELVHIADFSGFRESGRFYVGVSGESRSPVFSIRPGIYDELSLMSQRAFYFNRAGVELDARYAGVWSRPAGHMDDEVIVHASASSSERPAGTAIAAPGGWYDAGDHNKYSVNAAFATFTLLAAYAHCPACFDDSLNIPESHNDMADVLDEVLWNLNWFERMQDPNDGGVYHKLTALEFAGMVMPHEATEVRYVVQKTTGAALGFSAVFAKASRVYAEFRPALAARYLRAAEFAWRWAGLHPQIGYVQPDDVRTGAYSSPHEDFADEFFWAAVELYLATGDVRYVESYDLDSLPAGGIPTWD